MKDDKLPEMQQTAKGQQWSFGMKPHIAVDGKSKLIHTVLVAGANVADALALRHLLHGNGTRVWGDQASRGQSAVAPRARDFTNQRYRWGSRIDERIKATKRNWLDSGSFHANGRPAVERFCLASVNVVTSTCAPCLSTGRAPWSAWPTATTIPLSQ